MPVMDGTAAARTIRSFRPGVPIIGQSAYILESEKNSQADFFNDFIAKPVNKIEFRQKVKKFTDSEQIS
jgi:CheY-like chemotaxis protein